MLKWGGVKMFITKRNTGGVGMLGEEALWKRMWCVERLKNSGETLKTFSKLILSQFLSWLIKANAFLVWLNTVVTKTVWIWRVPRKKIQTTCWMTWRTPVLQFPRKEFWISRQRRVLKRWVIRSKKTVLRFYAS